MIRVIYRWQVEPENFESFTRAWRKATHYIHETVPGALGSFMLQACEADSEVLTVARWDSLASWKRFWGNTNPDQMQDMRRLGTRVSAIVYNEIEDFTR